MYRDGTDGIVDAKVFERIDPPHHYETSADADEECADWIDPMIGLSFAAAATTTIRIATGVLLLPEHNPVLIAKQVPGVDNVLHNFLEPTFADSKLYAQLEPSASSEWIGLTRL